MKIGSYYWSLLKADAEGGFKDPNNSTADVDIDKLYFDPNLYRLRVLQYIMVFLTLQKEALMFKSHKTTINLVGLTS